MKPERIQFAPWINQWDSVSPFIYKAFDCESFDDAAHCASHVHRVSIGFKQSKVETFIDGNNTVTVKIVPARSESLTDAQYALGQRIDDSLSYLVEDPVNDDEDDYNEDDYEDVSPVLN